MKCSFIGLMERARKRAVKPLVQLPIICLIIFLGAANNRSEAIPSDALYQDYKINNIHLVFAPDFYPIIFWDVNILGVAPNVVGAFSCSSACSSQAINAGATSYKYYFTKDNVLMVVYFGATDRAIGYGLDLDQDGYGNNQDDDIDGDGVANYADAFPFDPNEWADSDNDGVGNNADAFPYDPLEYVDSDGDGVGDNGDAFPNDPAEWADSNGNGIGDNYEGIPGSLDHKVRNPPKGEFTVDSSGAAVYWVPFRLPPGINGIEPDLGLVYSSAKRRGALRMGWSIAGLSAISRCPGKRARDGFKAGIDFESGERQRFCLDGEPLVLIPGGSNGIYGQAGTVYVTEKRNDLLVRAIGQSGNGPDHFEVKTGDGKFMIYGSEPVSKQRTNYGDCCDFGFGSRVKAENRDEILNWKLDSIVDRTGNRVSYQYHTSSSNLNSGAIYSRIHTVRYDANMEGGDFDVEVQFKWEDSQRHKYWKTHVVSGEPILDVATRSESFGTQATDGLVYSEDFRLKDILVRVGGNQIFKEYKLGYENSWEVGKPPINNLRRITECINSICSDPITFEWEYQYQGEPTSNLCVKDTQNYPGGEPAFSTEYRKSTPYTYNFGWENGNYRSQVLGDFNGDDLLDVGVFYTYRDANSSRMTVHVAHSLGNGEFAPAGTPFSELIGGPILNHRLAGDFNNDGFTDLMATNSSASGWNVYTVLNNQDGTFAAPQHQRVSTANFIDDESFQKVTGDFNGDGNLDVMAFGIGHGSSKNDMLFRKVSGLVAYVSLGNGDGTFKNAQGGRLATSTEIAASLANNRTLFTGDFNGDGITDIASAYFAEERPKFGDPYKGSETIVAFGAGDGTFSAPVFERRHHSEFPQYWEPNLRNEQQVQTADINGDGLTDIVAIAGDYAGILPPDAHLSSTVVPANPDYGRRIIVSMISNGDGSFTKEVYEDIMSWEAVDSAFTTPNCERTSNWGTVADFNSDGFSDISYGSANFLLGRGDGRFVKQGNRYIAGDDVHGTGGGLTADGYYIQDTTYGAYAFDVNRDGNPDAVEVVVDQDGLKVGTTTFAEGASQQYLNKVMDGYGRIIDITYEPISNGRVYTKGTGAVYPFQDVGTGKTVVANVSISDGLSSAYTLSYHYTGLQANLLRQEVLGFGSISATDSRNGMVTTRSYAQEFPLTGLLLSEEVRLADTTLVNATVNEWDHAEELNSIGSYEYRWFTLMRTSETQSAYHVNGQLIGTTSSIFENFDEYGRASTIIITSSDGYQSTKQLDIANNADWDDHYVSRINSVSETKSGPDYPGSITRSKAYGYYPNGLVHTETIEPSDADLYLQTTYEYDPYGRMENKLIAGHPSATYAVELRNEHFEYHMPINGISASNSYEMEVISTNPEGHETRTSIDVRFGHTLRIVDPNGLVTNWLYDSYGDLAEEIKPGGIRTAYTRDRCGLHCPANAVYQVFVRTTGESFRESYFDINDRELRVRSLGFDNTMIYRDTRYDQFGRVVYTSQSYYIDASPLLYSETTYDVLGRVERTYTSEEGIKQYQYAGLNGLGTRITKLRTRSGLNGQVVLRTEQDKNLSQLPTRGEDADGNVTTYRYDAYGNLKQTIDPHANSVAVNYNRLGRVTSLVDPDLGTREFGVDAHGQVRFERDAKNQQIQLSYDRLGRRLSRTKSEGTDRWVYDNGPNAIGKLVSETSAAGSSKSLHYDGLGRVETERHTIAGNTFALTNGYDYASRLSGVTYPTGFTVSYSYSPNGYLESVYRGSAVYWRANALNAKGERLSETFENGVTTTTDYSSITGRIESINSGVDGVPVQSTESSFDSIGNLDRRSDLAQNIVERFDYDNNNRLRRVYLNNALTREQTYNAIGNIVSKSDFATAYQYGQNGAGPHAVTQVMMLDNTQSAYTYDPNGNLLVGGGRSFSYTSFDKPLQIAGAGEITTFEYDANERRVRNVTSGEVTTYINPRWDTGVHYERIEASAGIRHKHYVNAGSVPVAVYVTHENGGPSELRYLHKDHLGSVTTVTNEAGVVVEELSYQAFGERRNPDWTDAATNLASETTHHGFTGHEHLDEHGLIHMNARLYDPKLGRFLTADTVIPSIENLEAFNRYTYVYNNPLSLTDPSGHYPYGSGFFDRFLAGLFGQEEQGKSVSRQASSGADYSSISHNTTMGGISQTPDSTNGGGGALDVIKNIGIGVLDAMAEDAWYSSPNPWFPGELSPAQLTRMPYVSPFEEPTTNEGELGRGLAPAAGLVFAVITRNPRSVRPNVTKGTGKALRPVGSILESVDDVLTNPKLLSGKTPAQVQAIIGKTPGWKVETLGKGSKKGQGWVFRQYNDRGQSTGQSLRWHPGGGHHGPDPYWRVTSNVVGKSDIIR